MIPQDFQWEFPDGHQYSTSHVISTLRHHWITDTVLPTGEVAFGYDVR